MLNEPGTNLIRSRNVFKAIIIFNWPWSPRAEAASISDFIHSGMALSSRFGGFRGRDDRFFLRFLWCFLLASASKKFHVNFSWSTGFYSLLQNDWAFKYTSYMDKEDWHYWTVVNFSWSIWCYTLLFDIRSVKSLCVKYIPF